MMHPDFAGQVDPYLDDELAVSEARALEAHLTECAECSRIRDERVALREAIRAGLPALRAPDAVRRRVQEALRATSPVAAPRRSASRSSARPRSETNQQW